jgi:hypothetical protein
MVRNGQSHALYDLSAQYREQQKFVPNVDIRQGALPYNHMPNLHGIVAILTSAYDRTSLMALTIACSGALIAIAWWMIRSAGESVRFDFSVASTTAILVSYHTLTYDLSLLLPVVLLLFAASEYEVRRQSQGDTILLVLLYLVLFCEPFLAARKSILLAPTGFSASMTRVVPRN